MSKHHRSVRRRLVDGAERLFRALPSLALGFCALLAVGLYGVLAQRGEPLRLSVVGHWAPRPADGQPLAIGRAASAQLRLLDPLVDAGVHAELHEGWIWNRSASQRLGVDETEITELRLLAGDRLVVHVPLAASGDSGLRPMAESALASPANGTRPVELQVVATGLWERLRSREPMDRRTLLQHEASGRVLPLDPLEIYRVPGGRLVPMAGGFQLESGSEAPRLLQDGEKLKLGEDAETGGFWVVRSKLESPKRLLGERLELQVRDGTSVQRFGFGERPLELGRWARLELRGTRLHYRDLGQRATVDIVRDDGTILTPGRAPIRDGSMLKLGHTRYRLEAGADILRLRILPRGGSERLEAFAQASGSPLLHRLVELLPSHLDQELFPPQGETHVSSGVAGQSGEAEYTLRCSELWGKHGLFVLRRDGDRLRVRSVSSVPVSLAAGGGAEPRVLRRRSELRSLEDVQLWEDGEPLRLADRLDAAGVSLELRRPDARPFTALVAVFVALLLAGVQVLFFALHRSEPLGFAGTTRTLYDLDPTSTRVRAVGQKVVLPPVAMPNLMVPACCALTMAGMMLQLRFWLDPRLLGAPDFFVRQLGALFVGLLLFFVLGLRRPAQETGRSSALPYAGGPLGIDWAIWVGMLFLMLTNLLTAAGIGSRHNGFFFRIPGLGLTIQFSAFAKIFFAAGFARMFAHGLQMARGSDQLGYEPHQLTVSRMLGLSNKLAWRPDVGGWLYSLRKVVFLSVLLGTIFGFYIVQNDLGPGLIFTLTLTLFLCFAMGQYNRGLRGFLRFAGPQGFLVAAIAGMLGLWLLLPAQIELPDGPARSLVAPVLDKVVERLNLWWEPWRFTRGEQVVQSLWTISGTSEEMRYFSNLHSDFAFAASVNHYGLIGGLLILTAFASFFASALISARALFRRAEQARDPVLYERSFTVLLASLMILVEAAIHIGASMNFSPLTGVTLPFISSGGTSIMVSFALLGQICFQLTERSTRAGDET